MRTYNISLIGFMCSGKTTIGRNIARAKGFGFYDTDNMIVDLAGKSITDIFNDSGEQYFRKLESDIIKSLEKATNSVISCGGGAVLNDVNMRVLREISTVVYLHASLEKIYENFRRNDKRPLLSGDNVEDRIKDLLKVRKPLYMKYCHVAIDVTDFDIAESVALVINSV